jgi:hypothetical protein
LERQDFPSDVRRHAVRRMSNQAGRSVGCWANRKAPGSGDSWIGRHDRFPATATITSSVDVYSATAIIRWVATNENTLADFTCELSYQPNPSTLLTRDGCGFSRGRQIHPLRPPHRFQADMGEFRAIVSILDPWDEDPRNCDIPESQNLAANPISDQEGALPRATPNTRVCGICPAAAPAVTEEPTPEFPLARREWRLRTAGKAAVGEPETPAWNARAPACDRARPSEIPQARKHVTHAEMKAWESRRNQASREGSRGKRWQQRPPCRLTRGKWPLRIP